MQGALYPHPAPMFLSRVASAQCLTLVDPEQQSQDPLIGWRVGTPLPVQPPVFAAASPPPALAQDRVTGTRPESVSAFKTFSQFLTV